MRDNWQDDGISVALREHGDARDRLTRAVTAGVMGRRWQVIFTTTKEGLKAGIQFAGPGSRPSYGPYSAEGEAKAKARALTDDDWVENPGQVLGRWLAWEIRQ